MLIFHRDRAALATMLHKKYINEASKSDATRSIAKFLVEITSIKNEFSLDKDLKQETRILNDVINNLIRGWSDSATYICSTTAHKFVEMGLSFNGKGRRSNNVKYINWVNKKIHEINEDKNEISAKQLLFAIAHSCKSKHCGKRYATISQLKDECKSADVKLNMSDYNKIKLEINERTIDLIHRLLHDERFNKNPMYFEHFIPVDDVKKKIYNIISECKSNECDIINEIENYLSNMLTCWTTVYENSKILTSVGRDDPWKVYEDAGISLCTRSGSAIKSKDDLLFLL